jgi:beta-phosphoglucomutase-like phosphatase (HAD superfamily)
LKVAQQLDVAPKNTLVIDDSDACVESAFRAGFPAIKFRPHPIETLTTLRIGDVSRKPLSGRPGWDGE